MVKWIVVMKIQPSICLDDWGKPRKKKTSHVGRHRDSNQGPPECESRALLRSHLARYLIYCNEVNFHKKNSCAISVVGVKSAWNSTLETFITQNKTTYDLRSVSQEMNEFHKLILHDACNRSNLMKGFICKCGRWKRFKILHPGWECFVLVINGTDGEPGNQYTQLNSSLKSPTQRIISNGETNIKINLRVNSFLSRKRGFFISTLTIITILS